MSNSVAIGSRLNDPGRVITLYRRQSTLLFESNMHRQITRTLFWMCLIIVPAVTSVSSAHFLWVKSVESDGKLQALAYFNENPFDESYHFPKKLANTKVFSRSADGKLTEIAAKAVDTDEQAGILGPITDAKALVLQTSQQYGIYGTSLLVYHAKHIRGTAAAEINSAGTSKDLKLEIVPNVNDKQVELKVLWNGKPLGGAAVTLFVGDDDASEKKTNDDGIATFELKQLGGFVGALANTLEKDKSGELDGKKYKGVMHYASLTFTLTAKGEPAAATNNGKEKAKSSKKNIKSKTPTPTSSSSILKPLPEPLASFGGVVCDGWLYVYGGHIGEEHEHSAANLSKHFRRIKLDGGQNWEELPMQTALQGLPLVTHGGKIYRVGGLNVRNATASEDEDLHSTAEFAEYDPKTQTWTSLAPLPAARSSHNAAVIGDRLYVAGGWRLDGKSPGTWEQSALVFDFTKSASGWQELPQPTFKRRAIATGIWHDKFVVIGGINAKGKVSTQSFIFDPQAGEWSKGPKLPGSGITGFGVSAWNFGSSLYVCGLKGKLFRLSDDGSAWEESGRVETPRFFHQLVPAPNGGLMVVGGASEDGHLATIERVEIKTAAKN